MILLNVIYSQQGLSLPSFGWTPGNFRARLAIAMWNFSFWTRKVGMHACCGPRPWVVWAWPLRFDPRTAVNLRNKQASKQHECVRVCPLSVWRQWPYTIAQNVTSDHAPFLQSAKGLEWDHVCLVNFFTTLSQSNGATKGLRHMLDGVSKDQ